MKGSNNVLTGTVVVLVAVAALLGFLIYKQKASVSLQPAGQKSQSTPSTTNSNPPSSSSNSVLDFPSSNASQQDQRAHFELVRKSAQNGDTVDITGCKPSPLVLNASVGATLTFKNSDSKSHDISLGQSTKYTIPANSSKDIVVNFEKGAGIYGYQCDGSRGVVGIFVAIK